MRISKFRRLLGATAGRVCIFALTNSAHAITASQLLQLCKSKNDGCIAYFGGVMDGYRNGVNFFSMGVRTFANTNTQLAKMAVNSAICIPKGTSTNQVIENVKRYLLDNPRYNGIDAGLAVILSIQRTTPYKKDAQK